jgi:hypothetical protein
VDIPISDSLLSSFTFSSLQRDGYQKRIPYPSATPYISDPTNAFHASDTGTYSSSGGQGQQVLRGKLLWKASDAVSVTTTLDWTHVNTSSVPESVLATETNPATPGVAFGFFYNACLQGIPFAGPNTVLVCGPRGPGLSGGSTGTSTGNVGLTTGNRLLYGNQFVTGNPDTTYATGQNFDKMDSYGIATTVDWRIAAALDLKSISGFRRLDWAAGVDADGSPLPILELSFREGQHQFSQEEQRAHSVWLLSFSARRSMSSIILMLYEFLTHCLVDQASNLAGCPCLAISETAFLSKETKVSPPSQLPS